MFSERRAHARLMPEDGYFLSCTPSGAAGAPPTLSTRLVDVSASGAGLQTLAPLRETASLDLSIILPDFMTRFRARGVVRWTESRAYGARAAVHFAGVRFEAVEETGGRATDWLGGAGGRPAGDPQRRHARFRPGGAEAFLLPRTWTARLGLRKETPVAVVDLGLGGLQVELPERLAPGLRASLRLRTARPDAALEAQVDVRWCRRDTRLLAPRWTAGLAFRSMRPVDAAALRMLDRHYLR